MKVWRAVVASPSDVQSERDLLPGIVAAVNRDLAAADRQLVLQVDRAEDCVPAGIDQEGPQGVVDRLLRPQDCDIFIGFFLRRFGSPAKGSQSGTEHEIRLAVDSWLKCRKPEVIDGRWGRYAERR